MYLDIFFLFLIKNKKIFFQIIKIVKIIYKIKFQNEKYLFLKKLNKIKDKKKAFDYKK